VTPLASLPKLREVRLRCDVKNLGRLAKAKSLKTVRIYGQLDPVSMKAVDTLRDAGIDVVLE
jgi:hypothetical protein